MKEKTPQKIRFKAGIDISLEWTIDILTALGKGLKCLFGYISNLIEGWLFWIKHPPL